MRRLIEYGLRGARMLRYAGWSVRCPMCGGPARRFAPYGDPPRPDAACVWCGSLERHRNAWLYLSAGILRTSGRLRILHVAPEPCFARRFARMRNVQYVAIDLSSPEAAVRADLCGLPFADGFFDLTYCSHVLEHVLDEGAALRELARVTSAAGSVLLQVPVKREWTYEDAAVVTPEERKRVFGQSDHVRIYGEDFPARVAERGFRVESINPAESLGARAVRAAGLDPDDRLYVCRKALAAGATTR